MRSIGIDPGDQAVKVVEVDGSYKKTRLLRVHVAPAGSPTIDGGTRVEAVATAARTALDGGMRGAVTLGHPCREAVLRTIELPFKGADAIRKVIKAEIEGEIQSQSVDDMVVDFHEIGEGNEGGTRILVASVPKPALRAQLAALSANAIEPEHIDLDTMALWRAAHWAGAFAAPDDEDDDDKASLAAGKRVTAVVDIGARSVRVLLVEGEHLVEMRALRLGDGVVAEELARRLGIDATTARDAAYRSQRTGADQTIEVAAALPATGSETEKAAAEAPAADRPAADRPAAMRTVVVRRAEVDTAHAAWLQRLARELTRFLTASGRAGQLVRVVVTGGANRSEGTREMLAAVFGVEVVELDLLSRLQHDLSPEEVEEHGSRLATALGLALGRLGGPEGFELRQEDLLLTRGFERVKFPLAIACMVALLALFVTWNKKSMELRNLEYQLGSTYLGNPDAKAGTVFFGMLNSTLSTRWFENPAHFRLEAKGKDYTWKDLTAELREIPVHKRLTVVHDKLKQVVDQKQKESGIYEDVSLESGLAVLVRWAEMLRTHESQLGRFLVTSVNLNMAPRTRRLEFTIAFRDDFREKDGILKRAIEAELQRADSPFEAPERTEDRKDELLFSDTNQSGVSGAYYKVVMHVKDSFPPFGPSGGAPVGAASVPLETVPTPARDLLAATGGGR